MMGRGRVRILDFEGVVPTSNQNVPKKSERINLLVRFFPRRHAFVSTILTRRGALSHGLGGDYFKVP